MDNHTENARNAGITFRNMIIDFIVLVVFIVLIVAILAALYGLWTGIRACLAPLWGAL